MQHYNPLIDARAAQAFEIPSSWQLIAQMPFGTAEGIPMDKAIIPLEKRLFVKK